MFAFISVLSFLVSVFLFIISLVIEKKDGSYKPVSKLALAAFIISFVTMSIEGIIRSKELSDVFVFAILYSFVATIALFLLSILRRIWHGRAGSTVTVAFSSLAVFFVCLLLGALTSKGSSRTVAEAGTNESAVAEISSVTESDKDVEITEEPTATVAEPEQDDVDNTDVSAEDSSDVIRIVSGVPNEYSQELVLNEGKGEDEYRHLGYFVPAGNYEVKNTGDYMVQITIYKNEKNITEEGWEEWTDGTPVLLKPDETADINIKEGYFIKIADGSGSVELKKKD